MGEPRERAEQKNDERGRVKMVLGVGLGVCRPRPALHPWGSQLRPCPAFRLSLQMTTTDETARMEERLYYQHLPLSTRGQPRSPERFQERTTPLGWLIACCLAATTFTPGHRECFRPTVLARQRPIIPAHLLQRLSSPALGCLPRRRS